MSVTFSKGKYAYVLFAEVFLSDWVCFPDPTMQVTYYEIYGMYDFAKYKGRF